MARTTHPLRQLIFASRARPGLRPADTSAIIATSRANNARAGVTGVLLYSGESFLQLVEGPDAAIAALWRRLLVDDRHCKLCSLYGGATTTRWSDGWRAGYVAEADIAWRLQRWRAPSPDEVGRLRAFLESARVF